MRSIKNSSGEVCVLKLRPRNVCSVLATLWLTNMAGLAVAQPGAPTLISPSGTITTSQPNYRWNAVVGAVDYLLWVNNVGSATTVVQQWYSGATICSGN